MLFDALEPFKPEKENLVRQDLQRERERERAELLY
jgi:hypothetical protein